MTQDNDSTHEPLRMEKRDPMLGPVQGTALVIAKAGALIGAAGMVWFLLTSL